MVLRKRVRYNVEGQPMTTVGLRLTPGELSSGDLLLVSQPDSIADSLSAGSFKSLALPYGVFEKQLSADIMAALGLGSMAYEPEDKYALRKHGHPQYSGIEVESFCSNREGPVLCSLVTFEVDGVSKNVSIPASMSRQSIAEAGKLQLAPKIGEMRLLAASTYARVQAANKLDMDMASDAFSGWIVPNGQAVDEERFPGAYAVFGSKLPVIDDYLPKLNPYMANVQEGQDSSAVLKQSDPMPVASHQHAMQNGVIQYDKASPSDLSEISFSYQVSLRVADDSTYDWSYASVENCNNALEYGYIACACTSKNFAQLSIYLESELDADSIDVKVLPSDKALEARKTKPSMTPVLALLYIGKPFSSGNVGEAPAGDGPVLKPDDEYEEYAPK